MDQGFLHSCWGNILNDKKFEHVQLKHAAKTESKYSVTIKEDAI